MLKKIRTAIKKYDMINKGETVCCALSGGADSVAALIGLTELSGEMGFSLTAVHINHLLRGEESSRDENFCRDLCEKMGVPLTVFSEGRRRFFTFSRDVCGNGSAGNALRNFCGASRGQDLHRPQS